MEASKPRLFLDTNVLFSGLYGPGPPATLLERHVEGRLIVVISRQVLEELAGVIRRKQPAVLPRLELFLTSALPEISIDPTLEEVRQAARCINSIDTPILAAALKCRVDRLVSGNTRHFTPEVARCAGIVIVTPAACLASLGA